VLCGLTTPSRIVSSGICGVSSIAPLSSFNGPVPPFTLHGREHYYVIHYVLRTAMPKLIVRRTGNSLGLPIPHGIVRELGLAVGDEVLIQIERVPQLIGLAGSLKGRITADEFTKLSNEGEELG